MNLRVIGITLTVFALFCLGLKHVFDLEFITTYVWCTIGIVGGLMIWIANIKQMGKEE